MPMPTPRTYGQRCAAAHALDLVGERWALLVVRELVLGPKRFTDLREGIPNASPNVLAQRLRELEESGIVRRRKLAPPAASRVYELTDWGKGLEPVLLALGQWGSRSPAMNRKAGMSTDSYVLAMKTLFDRDSAAGLNASYGLRLGETDFRAHVADGDFEVSRGEADQPDAKIETDLGTLAAVIWEDRDPAEAQRSGKLRIEGDEEAAKLLLGLFPRHQPVGAAALA